MIIYSAQLITHLNLFFCIDLSVLSSSVLLCSCFRLSSEKMSNGLSPLSPVPFTCSNSAAEAEAAEAEAAETAGPPFSVSIEAGNCDSSRECISLAEPVFKKFLFTCKHYLLKEINNKLYVHPLETLYKLDALNKLDTLHSSDALILQMLYIHQ